MLDQLETAITGTRERLTDVLDALRYNDDGLVAAIAQDADTGDVLMLAWMNRTAIERTLADGYATYYSRSRQTLWRKGETSGHVQRVRRMRIDCDGDAILLTVEQTGPACHTDRPTCFYLMVDGNDVVVSASRQDA